MTYDEYVECISELQGIYDLYSQDDYIISCGDVNVDVFNTSYSCNRLNALKYFVDNNDLCCMVPNGTPYTFRPAKKYLDCFIVVKSQKDIIISNDVIDIDECYVSDHLPVLCCVKLPLSEVVITNDPCILWQKCSEDMLFAYRYMLTDELFKLDLDHLECSQNNVDHLYSYIVNCIMYCSMSTLSISNTSSASKPY